MRDLEAEEAYANAMLLGVLLSARQTARRTYDTGDRQQSRECIRHHLNEDARIAMVTADHFHCPVCDHCLKLRPGSAGCMAVVAA